MTEILIIPIEDGKRKKKRLYFVLECLNISLNLVVNKKKQARCDGAHL